MSDEAALHQAVLHGALYTNAPWAAIDGLFGYPAGLSPDAARRLLPLLGPGPVLDPFVGGGAVALAARRAGRVFVGRDVSEAALCITRSRCWMPDATEAEAYRAMVHDIDVNLPARMTFDDTDLPDPMRSAVQATLAASTPGRAGRVAEAALRAWADERRRVPQGTPPPDLARADARTLTLAAPINGVLTSPPYPGVYDYDRWTEPLRSARGQHHDIDEEIGARRDFNDGIEEALAAWRADTRAWTQAVRGALRPGGRLVIVIGDGPRPDGPVDTREESIDAAAWAGLRLLAAATAEPGSRPSPRREHALLFERPGDSTL
jgi:SAM-dependent methyltransferase